MKPKVIYIEKKFRDHSGPAWIGFVEFSKSGQTVYFNNKALKNLKSRVFREIISILKPAKNTGFPGSRKMARTGTGLAAEKL